MNKLLILIFVLPIKLFCQNYGLHTFPEHEGKIIGQIINNNDYSYAILVPFINDKDKIEESNVCEINEFKELVNCKKMSDSSIYWNTFLTNDTLYYISTGYKITNLNKIDTLIIEKRDVKFNLIQKYLYYFNGETLNIPKYNDGTNFHIFLDIIDKYDDNFLEFIIPSNNDLTKIKLKIHDINNNIISSIITLNNSYLSYYLWGLAKTDTTFSNPQPLKYNILNSQGSIINAIDSGFVAFGSANIKNDPTELGIIKYNLKLEKVKIDTFGEGENSLEKPAVACPISKGASNYFVSGNIGFEADFYDNINPSYFYIGKYDKDINRIWLKKVGGDRHYVVWGVEASENGGCCIYGLCRSQETKYKTIPFIMCVDDNGSITSVEDKEIPYLDFTLLGNPGGNELKFMLAGQSEAINYKVSDLSGRLIFSGVGNTGLNTISANNWAIGVYIITFYNNGKLLHSEKWIKAAK